MKISVAMLKRKGACHDQAALFEKTFGREPVEVTLANCLKAADVGLNFDWAVNRFLNASEWAKYEKACASARAEYNKACASARAEVRASALAEHAKACASARAKYRKARASAFYNASLIK